MVDEEAQRRGSDEPWALSGAQQDHPATEKGGSKQRQEAIIFSASIAETAYAYTIMARFESCLLIGRGSIHEEADEYWRG